MYYRLHKHSRLVGGAKRGAIYDFQTGKVFSINGGAVWLLEACREEPLEELVDMEAAEDKTAVEFLDKITKMGLGSIYFMEGEQPVSAKMTELETPKLNFLWLELTSGCNNRCLHCYATSGPCVSNDCVAHERWLSLISEARAEGATAIQLIGGEPLLYPWWRELVVKAHDEGYEFIEIFTNATLIDDNCIEFFRQYSVNVATTIYAANAETHDRVTLNPGSFAKTLAAINKLKAADIPLRVASIIMKANEHEVDNIIKLCAELEVGDRAPDVVRPTGRGDDDDLLPESYRRPPVKPPFYTDEWSFAAARSQHGCLAGKIAVTAGGDVIPCIFARGQVCGNILATPLAEVLQDAPLQGCWHITKDCVEKCKDCEYRYACHDCRPLAQGSDPEKRWLACSAGCLYNPYTGEWAEETKNDQCPEAL
jgi:radical SAM protein with 4Fe4S-binding SPASM domain